MSSSSSGRTPPSGSSSASLPAAPGLAGGGGGERPGSRAAAAKRLLTLTEPQAGDALSPQRALAPDGTGAVPSASLRFQNARRLVALASGRQAQMAQTGSSSESALSAWSLPRKVTHRRWRSPLGRVCPQSGECLDIFFNLKVEESVNTQAHYQQRTRC